MPGRPPSGEKDAVINKGAVARRAKPFWICQAPPSASRDPLVPLAPPEPCEKPDRTFTKNLG
jgi:hypothetical protein